MPFRFLDHTADVLIEVHAKTLEGLLAESGKSLFAAMLDLDRVEPVVQSYFSVSGKNEEDLIDFLARLPRLEGQRGLAREDSF